MAAPAVVVISRDRDFSRVVAEQVKKQLAIACQIADTPDSARLLLASAALAITTEPWGAPSSCPTIDIKNKPLRLHDLLEEIAAALKRPAGEGMLEIGGGYVLQIRAKRLMHAASGAGLSLTDKEVGLLEHLAAAGPKGVQKEQLLKAVWGFEAGLETHTLETHIYRLRAKFRELAGGDEIITATDGGYALKSES